MTKIFSQSLNHSITQSLALKVQASIKKRCRKCKVIRRRGRVYIVCPNPRHKQRQG